MATSDAEGVACRHNDSDGTVFVLMTVDDNVTVEESVEESMGDRLRRQ